MLSVHKKRPTTNAIWGALFGMRQTCSHLQVAALFRQHRAQAVDLGGALII